MKTWEKVQQACDIIHWAKPVFVDEPPPGVPFKALCGVSYTHYLRFEDIVSSEKTQARVCAECQRLA